MKFCYLHNFHKSRILQMCKDSRIKTEWISNQIQGQISNKNFEWEFRISILARISYYLSSLLRINIISF